MSVARALSLYAPLRTLTLHTIHELLYRRITDLCGYSHYDSTYVVTKHFTAKFPAGVSAHDLNHWEQLVGEYVITYRRSN